MKQQWRDAGFLAFDLETWGLSPEKHRVAEFGAVWMRGDGEIEAYYSEEYSPGMSPVDEGAVRVHGIQPAQVAHRPTFVEALPEVLGFAKSAVEAGAIPLAFNAPFDTSFIAHAVRQGGWEYNPFDLNRCIDPLVWSRWRWLTNNKLADVAAKVGVLISRAHRAGDDAIAAARVFLKLAEHPDYVGQIPSTVDALLERQWLHVRHWERRTGRRYQR